ncbi:hypothetical protein CLOM_g15542 [Closterium sp. NIES-68]|nr:hypothetical protein CLOM_g15542 [Closterium sp. NIES-68]GJP59019.1 hypothetical protein CLOP_g7078 [Closterium sp. NIES-67]
MSGRGFSARSYFDSNRTGRRPVPPRDTPVTFGSWYKEAVADRRPAPLLGSLKPGSLRWMMRQLADSGDLAEWAELAETVLADPVYRDRLEWCEYERRLHRDGAAAAVQYARDAGWVDMTDTFAWSGVDMEMLGTSFTKPIPRTHASATAAPPAPAVFPYASGPATSGAPSARKRTARARQGRAGPGRPTGVNLATVRAQQEQLARRQERRQRQAERRQQQTGETENAGDSEDGWSEAADEGYMGPEKVSSDWLLDLVQKQQASIEERQTKGGRQGEVSGPGKGLEREQDVAKNTRDESVPVTRGRGGRSKQLPERVSEESPRVSSLVTKGGRRQHGRRSDSGDIVDGV